MDLSVVIPAYNESEVITRAVRHVDEFLVKEHIDGEIIVVNDGSTDEMGGVLAHIKNTLSPLKIISFSKNTGKGAACKAGFTASRGTWCIFMDADESTAINTWNTFKPFTQQFDILIGSRAIAGARILKQQSIVRVLAGKLGNKWIKMITGLPFYDTQCGFKAFHEHTKPLLAYAQVNGWAFDIGWLATAQKMGFNIKELPVEWHNDTTSLVRPIDYPRVLWEVVKIKFHIIKIPARA
ncbi:MAG: glycosyltransferase [Candidatus Magasanikbacteria bacterium]|nr:glycosyltransferase [Candidatus Magasanikbacteria bacterium]